jgi:hypothetical protein
MRQDGYLIITDISGYTSFLTQSELEHAHDVLDSLFKTLLSNIHPPMLVAKLEGDAIFTFSPQGSFIQGQTLLESIENLYFAFRIALETMRINTTCTCNACKLIPSLDLKFAVHYGEFIRAMVGGREELSGPDVILVHRLLKNTVIEQTGVKAYAYFTQQAADAMKLGAITDGMIAHTENYEHIGDVPGFVHDLMPSYQQMKERRRIVIAPEDGWFTTTVDLPAPPALVWDYLTEASRRTRWLGVKDVIVTDRVKGRLAVGSGQHCAHGNSTTEFFILDWRPFEYVTHEQHGPFGGISNMTSLLTPIAASTTRLSVTWSPPRGEGPLRRVMIPVVWGLMKRMIMKMMGDCAERMLHMISEDEQSGAIVRELPAARIADPA